MQSNPELKRSAASSEAALRGNVRIVRGRSADGLWVEEKWKHRGRTLQAALFERGPPASKVHVLHIVSVRGVACEMETWLKATKHSIRQ